MNGYEDFFNVVKTIDRTGQPIGGYSSGLGSTGYVSPVDALGMYDLNLGTASLMDVGRLAGWGEALNLGANRLGTAIGNAWEGFNNLGAVKAFKAMPGTDQLNAIAGTAGAIGSIWNGWQSNNLMKDQLKFQKDAFNKQYQASVKQYNTSLEDRQRARVASNPNAYQSVSEYMKANGMK